MPLNPEHMTQGTDTLAAGVFDTGARITEAAAGADTLAEQVFGSLTRLAEVTAADTAGAASRWVVTGGPFYSLAVVACFAGLCLLLYYFMPQAVTVINMFRGTLYVEKLLDEHNYIFETFRRLVILLGLVMSGLLIVRFADAAWGGLALGQLPPWALPLPVVGVWAALIGVWMLQTAALKLAGWLTYSGRFTADLIALRNLSYGLLFLLSVPQMLTLALAPGGAMGPLSVILFTVSGGLFIFLLIRTYLLFLYKNISILYWILYLCAVEILPVSFLVILTIRNIQ